MIDQPSVLVYDFMGNIVGPIVVITTANVYLIFRVAWKRRHRQAAWRRQRKLTIQLLCFAGLFIVFWFPLTINGLRITFFPSSASLDVQTDYFFFLVYMVPIFLPLITLVNLPHILKKVFKPQHRGIAPTVFAP